MATQTVPTQAGLDGNGRHEGHEAAALAAIGTDGVPAVEVRGLKKTYPGGVEAVRGIDFEVSTGEVFGLLGPNGAGKSTTVGMLTTTIVPTSGTARLAGYDVAKQPLQARQVSSVVFQDAVVDRGLSGRQNLDLHANLWGVPRGPAAERIEELAGVLGLSELIDRPVGSYSGGERRRLEIARALVSQPRVLFLDEPTVGLDPRIRHELLDAIAELRSRAEMTILLTTHYLDEAQRLADRVAIIHRGEIVGLDTPAALLAGIGNKILELHVDGDPVAGLGTLRRSDSRFADAFVVGSTLTVPLSRLTAAEAITAIDESPLVTSGISTRQPNLDDVYLRLTGSQLADAA